MNLAEAQAQTGRRILVAEDNVMFRSTLGLALQTLGWDSAIAENGVEGLKIFHANNGTFAAIVTDHEMPQMDGLTFVQAVREAGFHGPITVMSGNLSEDKVRAFQRYNVSRVFQKPFPITELIQSLA